MRGGAGRRAAGPLEWALMDLQRHWGLVTDGVPGPETRALVAEERVLFWAAPGTGCDARVVSEDRLTGARSERRCADRECAVSAWVLGPHREEGVDLTVAVRLCSDHLPQGPSPGGGWLRAEVTGWVRSALAAREVMTG